MQLSRDAKQCETEQHCAIISGPARRTKEGQALRPARSLPCRDGESVLEYCHEIATQTG